MQAQPVIIWPANHKVWIKMPMTMLILKGSKVK